MIPSRSHPCASSYTAVLRSGQLSAVDAVPLGRTPQPVRPLRPSPARRDLPPRTGHEGCWRRWRLRAHRGALGAAIGSRGEPACMLPVDHCSTAACRYRTCRPISKQGDPVLPVASDAASTATPPAPSLRPARSTGPRRCPSSRSSWSTPILHRPADRLIAEPAAEPELCPCRPLSTHILAPALAATYRRHHPTARPRCGAVAGRWRTTVRGVAMEIGCGAAERGVVPPGLIRPSRRRAGYPGAMGQWPPDATGAGVRTSGGSVVDLDRASMCSCPEYREEASMSGWLRAVLLAVALMVGTWALLVLLARRLPAGLLRDLAGFVPDCVTTVRRLRRDPRVPRRAKVVVVLAGLWLLSPVDLVPEFLPVIGPLDDVVVVALALRHAPGRCRAKCWSQPGRVSLGCWSACSAAQRQRPANARRTLTSGPMQARRGPPTCAQRYVRRCGRALQSWVRAATVECGHQQSPAVPCRRWTPR